MFAYGFNEGEGSGRPIRRKRGYIRLFFCYVFLK